MLSKVYIRKYHVRALLGVAVALVNMAVQAEMITYTGPNGTNPGTLFMPATVQSGGTYLWSDHEGIHSGGDYCIGKILALDPAIMRRQGGFSLCSPVSL